MSRNWFMSIELHFLRENCKRNTILFQFNAGEFDPMMNSNNQILSESE